MVRNDLQFEVWFYSHAFFQKIPNSQAVIGRKRPSFLLGRQKVEVKGIHPCGIGKEDGAAAASDLYLLAPFSRPLLAGTRGPEPFPPVVRQKPPCPGSTSTRCVPARTGQARLWGCSPETKAGTLVLIQTFWLARSALTALGMLAELYFKSGPGALCSQTSLPVVGEWTAPIPWLP